MNSTNKFIAGVITVPERHEHVAEIKKELEAHGIELIVFMDEEKQGAYFNASRMFAHFCNGYYHDYNILLCTDDIYFQPYWFRHINAILNNSDYKAIGCFSNKNPKIDDDKLKIHIIKSRWELYDQMVCFRAGFLTPELHTSIREYAVRPDAHKKELHHDNLVSSFIYESGHSACITVPNCVIHKDIKSVLGHNIVRSKELDADKNLLSEIETLTERFKDLPEDEQARIDAINQAVATLHKASPINQPVGNVQWVPIEMVEPNDYNPNSVAGKEMSLLYTSILHDGYTQPVVTIWDDSRKKYVIVDGFHRYFTCKNNKDILERNKGRLPIVIIEKDINDRMAATVRHNRARGKHSIDGMSSMVFSMLQKGWSDADICNELGMEAEELLRLKHITGFSKLFADQEYKKAWETKNQILQRKKYTSENPKDQKYD